MEHQWTLGKNFVTAVPPQQRAGEFWFKGTADSIHQNRNLVTDNAPDIVLVFGPITSTAWT